MAAGSLAPQTRSCSTCTCASSVQHGHACSSCRPVASSSTLGIARGSFKMLMLYDLTAASVASAAIAADTTLIYVAPLCEQEAQLCCSVVLLLDPKQSKTTRVLCTCPSSACCTPRHSEGTHQIPRGCLTGRLQASGTASMPLQSDAHHVAWLEVCVACAATRTDAT